MSGATQKHVNLQAVQISERIKTATMNRNVAVTRTISAGNCRIASLTRTFSSPEDAQMHIARRHSSAGVRALKWASASARSLGSTIGLENRASKENIFNNVVTPESIPQFTIPSLAIQDGLRFCGKDREKQCEEGGREGVDCSNAEDQTESPPCLQMSTSLSSSSSASSSSSGFGSSPLLGRKAHRSISDPTNKRLLHNQHVNCALLEGQDFPDPVTRAAFSLPHLPKVTTPYGFVTLSQSPQMANEEALFFQVGHRRCLKDEDTAHYRCMLDLNKNSASQMGRVYLPCASSASCPTKLTSTAPDHRISETERAKQNVQVSVRHTKSKFCGVVHRHITNLREKSL